MAGSMAAAIRAALKEGSKNQAIKQFGARAVAQELRRLAAAAEKVKQAKIADTPNVQAMGSVQAKKMTAQEKATRAFNKVQRATSKQEIVKSVDDFIKAGGKITTVPKDKAQVYRAEMEKELRGGTSVPRRERLKEATDPKKLRQARKLSEGRESTEAFEARMAREARQGGGRDVGRKSAQRGSAPDPMFEYEAGQASRLMRGEGSAPMSIDDKMKLIGRKKGGKVSKPRGVGCAVRGYGKAMTKKGRK
jgi:hypothetical protein